MTLGSSTGTASATVEAMTLVVDNIVLAKNATDFPENLRAAIAVAPDADATAEAACPVNEELELSFAADVLPAGGGGGGDVGGGGLDFADRGDTAGGAGGGGGRCGETGALGLFLRI